MRIGLALLLAAWAAPAAWAQDDLPKEPISGTIQTWYKVTQKIGDKIQHVGYVEETIKEEAKGGFGAYTYNYRFEAGLVAEADTVITVNFIFDAVLDEQFETRSLKGRFSVENVDVLFEYYNINDEKFIRVQQDRQYPLSKDEQVHFFLPLSTLQLRQQGLLSRVGKQTIKMFYPTETGKNTADVEIEVVRHSDVPKLTGDGRARITELQIANYPSTLKQLMQTYLKVDRYGRAVEISNDEGVTISMAKSKEEAVGTQGADTVRQDGRRDPFRKDLVLRAVEKKGSKSSGKIERPGDTKTPTNPENPEAAEAQLAAQVNELGRKVIALHNEKRHVEAERAYAEYIREYSQAKNKLRGNMRGQPYRDLMTGKLEVETIYQGAQKLVDQLVIGTPEAPGFVGRIEIAAKGDDLPEMEKIFAEMKKIRERAEFDEAPAAQKAFDVQSDICETLILTTKVRLDFLKIPMKLTATVIGFEDEPQTVDFELHVLGHRIRVREELPFLKSTTFAVIRVDGKKDGQYRKGDSIELDKDRSLKVVEITRYGATISWPEHERELPSKRKVKIPEQLRELPLARDTGK